MLPRPALVLFDIDGTLVRRAGPHHRQALIDAVRAVLGVETRNDNIPVHGMLDTDILLKMMANAGVTPRRARAALPVICREAERLYLRTVPVLRRKTCPGVRRLLATLVRRRAVLGVVSGNLEHIGWRKLHRADLKRYFRFGAFAGAAPDRITLARQAVRHAERRGWINGSSRRVLIGDTPQDVEAGHRNGLETIAVATGLCSIEELRPCHATLCVPDLTDAALRDWLRGALNHA